MSRVKHEIKMLLLAVPFAAMLAGTGIVGGNDCPFKVLANYDQTEEQAEECPTVENEDTTKPVVEAAISEEKLNIQAYDYESGVKSIYVNNYEYPDVSDGKLCIRLQAFDAGYENFKIKATDNAGNISDEYMVENPYYDADSDKQTELKENVEPTNPTVATATVEDYTEVKGDTDVRLFYTIETKTGKTFYLIIDRNEKEENVHFLTEISERDLLNTTSDNAQTLPKNSAALSAVQQIQSASIPEKKTEISEEKETETEAESETQAEDKPKKEVNEDKPLGTFIVLGIAGILGFFGYRYLNSKKKEEFQDEEDDTENEAEEEIFVNEDEENRIREKDEEFLEKSSEEGN